MNEFAPIGNSKPDLDGKYLASLEKKAMVIAAAQTATVAESADLLDKMLVASTAEVVKWHIEHWEGDEDDKERTLACIKSAHYLCVASVILRANTQKLLREKLIELAK